MRASSTRPKTVPTGYPASDAKNRTVVVQSIPAERYKAGERGPQVRHWREIGGQPKPLASGGKGFDLARYKAAAQMNPPQVGAYPQGEDTRGARRGGAAGSISVARKYRDPCSGTLLDTAKDFCRGSNSWQSEC
jgi:hypothetical protein